jgi:hypothetical protein
VARRGGAAPRAAPGATSGATSTDALVAELRGVIADLRADRDVRPGRFRATLGDHAWRSAYFSTAAAAAAAYDKQARKTYGELAFLNFPRRGERKVEPMDEDVCRQGHPRALFTYFAPDGRPGYCRKCNKLAQKRSAARRKARPCVSDMG